MMGGWGEVPLSFFFLSLLVLITRAEEPLPILLGPGFYSTPINPSSLSIPFQFFLLVFPAHTCR
jgi:hypothetical protein